MLIQYIQVVIIIVIAVVPKEINSVLPNPNVNAAITDEEIELAAKLREKVKNILTQQIMYEDDYLVRFLRGKSTFDHLSPYYVPISHFKSLSRQVHKNLSNYVRVFEFLIAGGHDVKKTEDLIRKTMDWRKSFKMDTIFYEDWTKWIKVAPFGLSMYDYEDVPVLSSSFGQLPVRKIILGGKQHELDRYLVYGYERGLYNIKHCDLKSKREILNGYLLFDLAGYSPRTHACIACIPIWIRLVEHYERYYPRLLKEALIVNSPRVFQVIFNVIKPYLTSHSVNILHMYGFDKEHWRSELLKRFPENVLTKEYGGKAPIQHVTSIHNKDLKRYMNFRNVTKS